ncbi:unnamed protein product [Symbiodinium sp. CCMP2592]|nr:unnamed protein product [Symbiodinium sp. CCMP2592]
MDEHAVKRDAHEKRVKVLREVLGRADADILSASTEAETTRICAEAHAQAGELLHRWRFHDDVSFEDLHRCCQEALKGFEVAVPLPPLPLKDPRAAPSAKPAAAEETAESTANDMTPFDWFFLQSSNDDVISALKAVTVEQHPELDGYDLLFGLPELWRFKTPFATWYSKSYHSCAVPLLLDWGFSECHVIRRSIYKGEKVNKTKIKLPIDTASLPGCVSVVASFLQNRSASAEALTQTWDLLALFDKFSRKSGKLALLPGVAAAELPLQNNTILIEDWSRCCGALGLEILASEVTRSFPNDRLYITLGKALFVLLRSRQKPSIKESVQAQRITKRVVHTWTQSVQRSFEGQGSPLLDVCPEPSRCASFHPLSKSSRMKGSTVLRENLLNRFSKKSSGFVTTKEELNLQQLGLISSNSRFAKATADEFLLRWLAKASTKAQASAAEGTRLANWCMDSARACTFQVLALQCQLGDTEASLIQVLPDTANSAPSGTTLQALNVALQGGGLQSGGVKLQPTFKELRSYRVSTKNLLHATKNSLALLYPNFSFAACLPENVLHPNSSACDRYLMTDKEKEIHGLKANRDFYFLHRNADDVSLPDFPSSSQKDVFRLVFSGDEGSENLGCFLHLAHCNVQVVWWPDLPHKLHRKQAAALKECPAAAQLLKLATKVFRATRGPYGSSRFGRGRKESRTRMLSALDECPDSNFLQCCLSGMARDQGLQVFVPEAKILLAILLPGTLHWSGSDEVKEGSWHMQLAELLWQYWETGENPYLNPQQDDSDKADSYSIRALAFQVLSDATNQDKLRSLIAIFKPARKWMTQLEKDLQSEAKGPVRQAFALATGARVQHLVRETIASSTTFEALQYIGVSECNDESADTMEVHTAMLCAWLGRLVELADHHRCLPWRAILATNDRRFAALLDSLRREVEFVHELDKLSEKGQLYKYMSFTRWQCVRELLVEAESINFDSNHEDANEVRKIFLAAAGLKHTDAEASLLTSLPCELIFNDLRDGERRGQKQDYRSPPAICCAAVKSGWSRSPLAHIQLEGKDWSDRSSARHLKANILQGAARATDKELGIPMQQLTNARVCEHITKPHVLTQRLQLYCCLSDEFSRSRAVNLELLLANSWPCKMLCAMCLWKVTADDESEVRLVLQAGPWLTRYVTVEATTVDNDVELYKIPTTAAVEDTLRFDGKSGLLSMATGVAHVEHGLLFRPQCFLHPTRFLLTHRIYNVTSTFVQSYCKLLGLQLGKSTHQDRVRALLQKEGYEQEYITEVLDSLPLPKTRKPQASDEQEVWCSK